METDIESWAREKIAEAGGLMLKWTSPGTRGVPDDIVFWPDGTIDFIEFKFAREVLKLPQQEMRRKLSRFGHVVYCYRTKKEVLEYLRVRG